MHGAQRKDGSRRLAGTSATTAGWTLGDQLWPILSEEAAEDAHAEREEADLPGRVSDFTVQVRIFSEACGGAREEREEEGRQE